MRLLNKYKLDISSRRLSNDSENERRKQHDESTISKITKITISKDQSSVSRDSRRLTHTEREFSADFTNKENDNCIIFDVNPKTKRGFMHEERPNDKTHRCCNNMQDVLIRKLDTLDDFMKMQSSMMSNQIQGILDILYNLKEELDYVKNSIQTNEYGKHIDKENLDKETQTITDKWLVTFNKQSSSLDSVKWK